MSAPLSRYRVVHLTANVPGPLAAARLARAGAKVTKVEPPTGDGLGLVAKGWYQSIHEGQSIEKLDLKSPEGMKRMDALLGDCDVFLTTTRPQSLARLGLDWKSLSARFPKLCMVQIQGFPAPQENHPAHDLLCQAKAGLLTPPVIPRALISDFGAAERAYSEALVLLLARESTGKGGYTAVTLMDSAQDFAAAYRAGLTRGDGVLGGGIPNYGLYPARGGWVALGALEPHFIARFVELTGIADAKEETLKKIFATRSPAEWEEFGGKNDIPIAALENA